jgi:HPt (histidine-containing phosphotransfer) domain-containing protein
MQMRGMVSLSIMIAAASVACADEPTPQQILDRVAEKYKTMQTYQCEGSVFSEMDDSKDRIEMSFSMKLKKGNLYLITWSHKSVPEMSKELAMSGVVWNAGAQPFLCVGHPVHGVCFKMADDARALASAVGDTQGASRTIPALFFSATVPNLTSCLKLYARELEQSAKLAGEDCYVVSGRQLGTVQVTLWISQQDYLIRQCITSMGSAAAVAAEAQQMTDQQLEQALKEMGLPSTSEDRAKMRESMKNLAEAAETMKASSSRTCEHYTGISSPELKPADFVFKIPEDCMVVPWPPPGLPGAPENVLRTHK